jgi:hypothetical protein
MGSSSEYRPVGYRKLFSISTDPLGEVTTTTAASGRDTTEYRPAAPDSSVESSYTVIHWLAYTVFRAVRVIGTELDADTATAAPLSSWLALHGGQEPGIFGRGEEVQGQVDAQQRLRLKVSRRDSALAPRRRNVVAVQIDNEVLRIPNISLDRSSLFGSRSHRSARRTPLVGAAEDIAGAGREAHSTARHVQQLGGREVVAAPTTADIGVREQRRTQYVVGCAVLGTGRHDRTQILGQAT